MTGCGDGLGVLIAADRASEGLYTSGLTTGSGGHLRGILMAKCIHFIRFIAMTTGTGISSITLFGTGRCSDFRSVAMACGGDGLNLGVATGDAGIGDGTGLGAGGVHSHSLVAVTKRCNLISLITVTTGAGVGGVALVGTGRCSYLGSCLLYTSPSPRDPKTSRMPSSA